MIRTTDSLRWPIQAPARPESGVAILIGAAAITVFIGGFAAWATLAPLASAAVAPGRVTAESNRKTVQHLEGGIVRDILVREGDRVEQGQVLLRLDNSQSGTTLDLLQGQFDAMKAAEARLAAERDGLDRIEFPQWLQARRTETAVAAILVGQERIFASRQATQRGQSEILEQRVRQLEAEITAYRAQVASQEEQAALIREEVKAVESLVNRGLERKTRLLALQRQAASLAGNRGELLGQIARAEQAIGEAKLQAADLVNARLNEVAVELRDTQNKIAELEERMQLARDVNRRLEIAAPQAGRIVSMRFVTPGGVIRPGEPVLDIVPEGDVLVIDARVAPTDIDVVRVGLPADVVLTAYKRRTTPILRGNVIYVSADSLIDEEHEAPYYEARIEIEREQLTGLETVELYPGMPAEVMIVTGERTPFAYLVGPLRDSFRRAFREE